MSYRYLATAVLALVACDRGGPAGTDAGSSASSGSAAVTAPPAPTPAPVVLPSGVKAPATFADLAAKADPAVVYVRTLQQGEGRGRRFVGEGLGSAFVFDPDGLILTNNHVISNAREIKVIFGKAREMTAEVVGRDAPTDIAVLRVAEKGLPFLPLGNSDATRVGDWVVAIGNPFGLSHTVSAGIVSAKGRTGKDVPGLGDGSGYYNFLQTDASINPGNSGGPLLDMGGAVVGINTAIRAKANNIGFAIPIAMVKELLPKLIKDGKIRRSAIGIVVASVGADDVQRLGLDNRAGALVRRVLPGGPADRAGLAENDVILALNGRPIAGPERLRWEASNAGVGSAVKVRVARGKRTFDLEVTLGELPERPRRVEPRSVPQFP